MNSNLRVLAYYYYKLGLRVSNYITKVKEEDTHIKLLFDRITSSNTNFKQKFDDIINLNWEKSSGIFCELDYNNLRCIEFKCLEESINGIHYNYLLEILKVPNNYEWIIYSKKENKVYILFYEKFISKHFFYIENEIANENRENYDIGYKLEKYDEKIEITVRNSGIVTLPSLKKNGNRFINCILPKYKPIRINNMEDSIFENFDEAYYIINSLYWFWNAYNDNEYFDELLDRKYIDMATWESNDEFYYVYIDKINYINKIIFKRK